MIASGGRGKSRAKRSGLYRHPTGAPEQTTHAERVATLRDDIGVRQRRPRGFSDAALHRAVDVRGALDFGDRADEVDPTNARYAKVSERFRRTLRQPGSAEGRRPRGRAYAPAVRWRPPAGARRAAAPHGVVNGPLPLAARSCREGGSQRQGPADSMKRAMEFVWPAIGLAAVAFSFWLLWKELRGISLADVAASFDAIPASHWFCAVLSTLVAYGALAWYDRIGLAHLGRRLSWGFISLTSFTTYALSHNIGASVFSGAVVRYRAYSTKGLGMAEVGLLVAFCSFTFFLGTVLLGGLVLTFEPGIIERWVAAPDWLARLFGLIMLFGVAAYMAGSLLHFRPLKVGQFELVYPRPPIAARQFFAAPLELLGAAGIIYFALPAAENPGFFVVLGIFVASFSIALLSHAPGGLGVLELAFVKAMPDTPHADLVAALLAFRLLYLILPLVFALVVVVLFERGRIAEIVRAKA
jgi:hypothetical protein